MLKLPRNKRMRQQLYMQNLSNPFKRRRRILPLCVEAHLFRPILLLQVPSRQVQVPQHRAKQNLPLLHPAPMFFQKWVNHPRLKNPRYVVVSCAITHNPKAPKTKKELTKKKRAIDDLKEELKRYTHTVIREIKFV